ncbi:riboflavin synthase [candidate division KSB1 bacterium]
MFTGIIKNIGKVSRLETRMERLFLQIEVDGFTHDLQEGSSISVDGVCLTVTALDEKSFSVDAVKETLKKTTIVHYKAGTSVNLEKAVRLSDRLDGHMVQGHVDGTGTLTRRHVSGGNVLLSFGLTKELIAGVVPKGSICIDGVSLTVVSVKGVTTTVTLVPFTLNNTTLAEKKVGSRINVETDIIGKYVARFIGNNVGRKSRAHLM